jgi:hypothetical protein
MTQPEDDLRLDAQLLAAYEVEDPPADLADRVLARLAAERTTAAAPRAAGRRRWLGAIALSAAAAFGLWFRATPSAGTFTLSERAEVRIGARAVAVGERGAALSYRVSGDGSAHVTQTAGNVFFRVEHGRAFTVATPAGEVTVKGTCFRVEVSPMSIPSGNIKAAAVGALAATSVFLTVYEGRVLFANEHGRAELSAGERASARADEAPRAAAGPGLQAAQRFIAAIDAPGSDITREELLRRDQVQRENLVRLRDRVKELEADAERGGAKGATGRKEETFVDPPKEELLDLAKQCRLAWDMPSLEDNKFGDRFDKELSADERASASKAAEDWNARALRDLRALYVEITGDARAADVLSSNALQEEIINKSADHTQLQALFQRLSRERAGLAAPPADLKGTSPVERYFRLVTGAGDQFERAVGQAIGAGRAHELRAKQNGWGTRHGSSYGCPGE